MRTVISFLRVSMLVGSLAFAAFGCSSNSDGGNARVGAATVTRASELKDNLGKEVTLVGTARNGNSPDDSRLQLRGGAVDLPSYRWPEGYVNHPVSVTGTIVDAAQVGASGNGGTKANPAGAFRIGDVKDVQRWSR